MLEQDLCRTSVTRRNRSADAQTGVYRSSISFEWCAAMASMKRRAATCICSASQPARTSPNLLPHSGRYIAAAHFAPQARHHLYDLFGSVIAVGAIEREEVLDGRKQHHESFGATASCAFQELVNMFAETGAIERAGRRVETRALLQLFGRLVLSRDNAYEAVRAPRLAARVGKPSAAILNPCRELRPSGLFAMSA